MMVEAFSKLDFTKIPSPCHLLHRGLLERNCRILRSVMDRTGCKILLALKGYAQFSEFKLINQYLAGTTASGLHEALLGFEEFGGEVHVYSPAFKDDEMAQLVRIADHISFNTPGQWQRHRARVESASRKISCGIRVNPEYAEVAVELYNPCAPCSRLGTPRGEIKNLADLDGLEGLHFHTMCEQNSDVLARTIPHFEEKFGDLIPRMKWINFGGGHHITRSDYDVDLLCKTITDFRKKWGEQLAIYLEPGEAIALGTGVLVSTVIDIVHNGMPIALLDTSATAHMPDTLEMPYRAEILGAGKPGEFAHTYRLGSTTCLAGDVMGDYSFPEPLKVGDKVVFLDMSHYTMVKNTTFNGINLPSIATYHPENNEYRVVKKFGYADYKNKLS
ncbi:MAG: carboxynorspermidine decarboxylase [Puniceicoccales bacterium]|jgi:carboxynorspermidine decarboxylase|nr:carboxynorspermidine decarboxylase [Puniceicoccales bacterium]